MSGWFRRYGWLAVRLLVAAITTAIGILGTYLPFLPPKSPVPVTSVAIGILLVLYASSELARGLASRRETSAYRDHVRDLQDFAREAGRLLDNSQYGAMYVIDLAPPMGRAFRKHFPAVGIRLDEWNQVASGYTALGERFRKALADEEARLELGSGSGFFALLELVARGLVRLSDMTWSVQNGWLVVGRQGQGSWTIASIPTTEEETARLLQQVSESATHVGSIKEVEEWFTGDARRAQLRAALIDDLKHVEATHDPSGRCDHCPG